MRKYCVCKSDNKKIIYDSNELSKVKNLKKQYEDMAKLDGTYSDNMYLIYDYNGKLID